MSKPSHRPTREARKKHKTKKQAVQRELHRRRAEAGLSPPTPASANVSNRLSEWKTGEEEQAGREEAAGAPLRVWRALVDKLLKIGIFFYFLKVKHGIDQNSRCFLYISTVP
jgi:hypothetical protein